MEKIVKVLRSVYSAFLDLSNRFERLQESYSRERSRNGHLKGRLQEMMDENQELRETAEDMECIKALFGSQKVEEAISQAKQQEKVERGGSNQSGETAGESRKRPETDNEEKV